VTLEREFKSRRDLCRFESRPVWRDGNLMIGAGTCLVNADGDIVPDSLHAILSAASGKDVKHDVMPHVESARRFWLRGEAALAQLRLVYAPIDEAGAFRAFLAERALAAGASLDDLRAALGLGAPVEKYSDTQPRVPSGSGRASGRWASGDDASGLSEGRSASETRTAFLDTRGETLQERQSEKEKHLFGGETIEDEAAHGHAIPALPTTPPLPLPGGAGPARTTGPLLRDGTGSGGGAPPGNEPPSDDRDRLCPKPEKETGGHGDNQPVSKAYQEYVGQIVNPGAPIVPAGMGYGFIDPTTGRKIIIDHCRFKDGAFIDAKAVYAFMLERHPTSGKLIQKKWDKLDLARDFVDQALLQLHIAQAYGGRAVEWWFKEEIAAEFARDLFEDTKDLKGRIVVKHVPFGKK
jgi:hypothetical protein